MVISKKPLQFIAATLIAFLPLISIANPSQDSTAVHAEAAHTTKVAATHEEHAETPKDLKTEQSGSSMSSSLKEKSIRRKKKTNPNDLSLV